MFKHITVYNVVFQRDDKNSKSFNLQACIASFNKTFMIGSVLLGGLILSSYFLEGSTKFFFSTWGFM